MQRKGERGGAGQDPEAVLDELYTTPPPDFVARREELAAAAKAAGRTEHVRRIRAARRPTLAAWAANLLLRSRPEESERFLELGQALREAYQTLDAEGIKELNEQRRSVVAALSGQAAALAQEAGHRLSDAARQDVDNTLRAVLADQDAADQWATGRLESALTPPSAFPRTTGAPPPKAAPPRAAPPRAAPPAPKTPKTPKAPPKDELADRRRKREQEAEQRARDELARAELARAKKTAEAAQRRLRDRRAAHAQTDEQRRQARAHYDEAHHQVSALERQLQRVRDELRRAEADHRTAEERHRTAADALTEAERDARAAARAVDDLR